MRLLKMNNELKIKQIIKIKVQTFNPKFRVYFC
jgi:hypothetical protein